MKILSDSRSNNGNDPANICSKSTIETLENGVKYVQSQQYKHQNDVSLNMFYTFF